MAKRPPNPTARSGDRHRRAHLDSISYPDPARPAGAFREAAARAFDRSYNPAGAGRQLLAILADGGRANVSPTIDAPTLRHPRRGRPAGAARRQRDIARLVPHAKLEVIEEMAHDLPPSQLKRVAGLIAAHAKAAP